MSKATTSEFSSRAQQCKYGYFDFSTHEYVITSPFTPKPWINYLGCVGELDAFVSNRAGGTLWYEQPHTGRISRYRFIGLPDDTPGFYLYVKENDGRIWSPSYMPVLTELDRYECRHGLYYTKFSSEKNGLAVDVKYMIPRADAVLLWDVTLKNNTSEPKDFKIYPYMDFSMRDYFKDELHFQATGNQMRGSYNSEYNALAVHYQAYQALHPGYTLFNASKPFHAFDMKREDFIGPCRYEGNPIALEKGCLSNSEVSGGGFCICGTFELDFHLQPGESERVIIKTAVAPELQSAGELLKKYDDFSAVDAAADDFATWWRKTLAVTQVSTPDPTLNELLNVWFPKNVKVTMRCGRSISHRHTGIGTSKKFRDTMQDIMSGTLFFPEETRENILLLMHSIRQTGQITYSIDPGTLTAPDPEHIRCDAIVWGIFTIYKYISETGDRNILDEKVKDYEKNESTVLDLLLRGMRFTGDHIGVHGLPSLFNCDWNDALVIISSIYSDGESVMVAEQYIAAAKILLRLLEDAKYAKDKEYLENKIEDFTAILDSPAVWDGSWYRRLLFPSASMGSSTANEGKIFLNTQSWAALAGTLNQNHVEKALESAYQKLNTHCGLRLCAPPYTKNLDGSPFCGNSSGAGENGGLFYHANTWAIMAEAMAKHSERAWEYFRNVLPSERAADDADLYEREPYAFASWLYGPDNASFGRASLTHLTGGASWIYHAAMEYLLGIRPVQNGLQIAPVIPAEWNSYKVVREFAGARYVIEVKNPLHKSFGTVKLTVDGKAIDGSLVPKAVQGTISQVCAEIS